MTEKKVKFNIIDIGIILMVLVLLCGFAYYALGPVKIQAIFSGKSEQPQLAQYQIEFKQLKGFMADQIKVGDLLAESITTSPIGKIINVETTDATDVVENLLDGRFDMITIPNRYNTIITVESDYAIEEGSMLINGVDIKVGKSITVRTDYYAVGGTIITMTLPEGDGQ